MTVGPCKSLAELEPFGFCEFFTSFRTSKIAELSEFFRNSETNRNNSTSEISLRPSFFSRVLKTSGWHFLALSMLQMIYFGRFHFLGNGTFIFHSISYLLKALKHTKYMMKNNKRAYLGCKTILLLYFPVFSKMFSFSLKTKRLTFVKF